MRIFLHSLSLLLLALCLPSCKMVRSLVQLRKTSCKIYVYHLDDKEIHFLPMHHLGKKEFYDDVKTEVLAHKKDGYIVFYELISSSFTADSTERDLIRRKMRRMKGFSGTYKELANDAHILTRYIQQPAYNKLGTTNADLRADVDYLQLVRYAEGKYGTITLDSTDMHTPLNARYHNTAALNRRQHQDVIIHYRNRQLVQLVAAANNKKILVLYGEGHRKDFRRQLAALSRQ